MLFILPFLTYFCIGRKYHKFASFKWNSFYSFNKYNNLYSVTLNDNEEELKFSYDLKDKEATVDIFKDDNKTTLHILNSDHSEENYVFYINKKEETVPVFKETYEEDEKPKEIPHLKLYVSLVCLFIIAILFKFIVL